MGSRSGSSQQVTETAPPHISITARLPPRGGISIFSSPISTRTLGQSERLHPAQGWAGPQVESKLFSELCPFLSTQSCPSTAFLSSQGQSVETASQKRGKAPEAGLPGGP